MEPKHYDELKRPWPILFRTTQILVPLLALIILPWGLWVTSTLRRIEIQQQGLSDRQNGFHQSITNRTEVTSLPASAGPVSAIGSDKIEIGLTRKGNALLSTAIINRSTGFNWVVPNSTAGPWLLGGDDIFWNDQSGNHNNAFAVAGRPEITTSTFSKGDMPVVRFHGNDYFTLADSAKLRLPEFSVYAIINVKGNKEQTTPTTMQTYYSSVNPQNLGNGMILQVTPGRKVYFFTSGAQDNPDGKGDLHNRALYDPMTSTSAVTYYDTDTGLSVRLEAVTYSDFPTVEWMLYFQNTGDVDTLILDYIKVLDIQLERGSKSELVLHHQPGSQTAA